MRFRIYCRDDDNSCRIGKTLVGLLHQRGHIEDNDYPELVIFVGGDGTFLRAVSAYIDRIDEVAFIGVHAGTLGFFCDYEEDDLEQLVANLEDNAIKPKQYRLLEARVSFGGDIKTFYGVNEIRLEDPFHTLIADVHINGNFLERYRGNGLIVSSVLGSSGYNRSLGGALIDNRLEALQLSEIATIQNNAFRSLGSSLVLSAGSVITFSGSFPDAIVGIDHMSATLMSPVEEVQVRLADHRVRLYHQDNHSYLEVLRKTFIKD